MKCPVCGKTMVERDFGDVHVDVCADGCKGIWFDWMELIKLDESHEGMGCCLQDALSHPRTNDENRPPLICPKCGIKMQEHKYRSSKEVNVDECYSCGGFFLDSGELHTIRESFMSEEERLAYNDKLLGELPEYAIALDEQEKKLQRARALKNYTKSLRMSYHMGKR